MPKRPKSNGVKTETANDAPPSVRRSKRVKMEVKYEPEEHDIKEEDEDLEDLQEEKENLGPKRGASRGSKYSNAKTVLTRGVKSVVTDKGMIKTKPIRNLLDDVRFRWLEI